MSPTALLKVYTRSPVAQSTRVGDSQPTGLHTQCAATGYTARQSTQGARRQVAAQRQGLEGRGVAAGRQGRHTM